MSILNKIFPFRKNDKASVKSTVNSEGIEKEELAKEELAKEERKPKAPIKPPEFHREKLRSR